LEIGEREKFFRFYKYKRPLRRFKIFSKYDIQSTPQIYVLDENKIIRSKSIEAKQLDEVVDYLIKDEAQKIAKQVNKK